MPETSPAMVGGRRRKARSGDLAAMEPPVWALGRKEEDAHNGPMGFS